MIPSIAKQITTPRNNKKRTIIAIESKHLDMIALPIITTTRTIIVEHVPFCLLATATEMKWKLKKIIYHLKSEFRNTKNLLTHD